MRLSGSATVPLEIEEVWRRLQDPAHLLRCTPGLVRLDPTSSDHYDMGIELALPALRGRFEGTVDIRERLEHEQMRLQVAGKGAPGFVDGEASLRLVVTDASTRVEWSADVQIGGTLARLGQRMLSGIVLEMAGEFFSNLGDTESGERPVQIGERGRPAGLRAVLRWLWRAFLGRIGLSRRR